MIAGIATATIKPGNIQVESRPPARSWSPTPRLASCVSHRARLGHDAIVQSQGFHHPDAGAQAAQPPFELLVFHHSGTHTRMLRIGYRFYGLIERQA